MAHNASKAYREMRNLMKGFGYTDLELSKCGHLRGISPTGEPVFMGISSDPRAMQNARSILRRKSKHSEAAL
jgi:hypothetical protein